LGLLFPTVRHQLAGRPDHAPPGKTGAPGENITNGTGRSGIAGAPANLAVTDNLSAPKIS
jgi:hypothetical protein